MDAVAIIIVLFVVAFVGSLAAGIVARIYFEKLIDIECTRHREHWLQDGSPIGGALSRAAAPGGRSQIGQAPQFSEWSYKTPAWVVGDQDAEVTLARMRWWGSLQLRIAAGFIIPAIGVLLWHAVAS